jgi:polar amino acid transport system substrate-binding protein
MTQPDPALLHELAPSGRLRLALAMAPSPTAFFAAKDPASGEPRGVTVELGRAMAQALGVPLDLVPFPNSGELTAAAATGAWDITFMPKDAERAQQVDFGPAYSVVESTYLVPAGSGIGSIAAVDRPGTRIVAIANTTTARSAQRTSKHAQVQQVRSVDEMIKMAQNNQADAFALSHDAFAVLLAQLPGARVLDGHFQAVGVCVAVPRNRPLALRYAGGFVENAKRTGLVRRALDDCGFHNAVVAPPEP